MGLTPGILKSIYKFGFEYPLPMQERVILFTPVGEKDIINLPQTGTGFIELLNDNKRKTRITIGNKLSVV